ncbi:amidase [Orrella sp. 11846]|uniref:amidase n=1 Tax=Orrella sp. 11846 TaxID=3409913 RepID=UPI003B5AB0D2
MSDICWLSASELAAAYRKRELTPLNVVKHLIDRIQKYDSKINVFTHLDAQGALHSAQRATEELNAGKDLGPLHGIPYGVKDIIDVQGLPTTCHSELFKENIATQDATVVSHLRQAGAIALGKIATHEFAIGGPAFDLPFPPARNPWKTSHHPGGSSSGSGAGVGAGFFPVALGTDTGGSVRNPAGTCGVMGFKPGYDKVSRNGVFPLSWTLDYVGPLARKVEDLASMLNIMTSVRGPKINPDIQGLRIGFVRHYHEKDMQAGPDTAAALQTAVDTLQNAGATIIDVELPPLREFIDINRAILTPEAWATHSEFIRAHPEKYCKLSRQRIMVGAFVTAEAHLQARMMGLTLRDEVNQVFEQVDALILVNSMNPSCEIDDEAMIVQSYFQHARAPFNLSGHPAMSMMCGLSGDGLPISMQIVGPYDHEHRVLNIAAAYEAQTQWSDMHPTL